MRRLVKPKNLPNFETKLEGTSETVKAREWSKQPRNCSGFAVAHPLNLPTKTTPPHLLQLTHIGQMRTSTENFGKHF